jgi:hypothetical protein
MRRIVLVQAGAITTMLLLLLCASVRADVFGPISLASDDALEQADYAHDPVISGNGEYVAFDGYFEGLTGVWRRDLKAPYAVEAVSVGEPGTPAGSAVLPSISENGQLVSFTTAAALSPVNDTNAGPDVYVRDMDVPEYQPCVEAEALAPAEPCAFTLVSAADDSTHGLSYEYSEGSNREYEEGHYGAVAAGRSAMSANGEKVVFVTTLPSDLDGPQTPTLQVARRNLLTGSTELVSVASEGTNGTPLPGPQPVPVQEGLGAVYDPGPFEGPAPYVLTRQAPASISADGSTVAWLAENVGEQVQTLADETLSPKYSEPLWRRMEGGEATPTRRVSGGSDPANPACAASGETDLPEVPSLSNPCQGPFATIRGFGIWTNANGVESAVPQLSADGNTVAFIAQAPLVALGSDFGVTPESRNGDLYIADMQEGLTRVQALTPLTELASGNESALSTNASIIDFGISPDASQVAFTTMRTQFPLGSPAFVSAPAAVPGMVELFDVDLGDDTLTRVTHGYDGGPSESPHEEATSKEDQYVEVGSGDGALSPSFSNNGDLIAFASTASNLVFGDGNTPPLTKVGSTVSDGSDVFVVPRETFLSAAAPQSISSAPAEARPTTPWRLGVTAVSLADGAVRLYLEVPGAGSLRAVAGSQMLLRSSHSAHKTKSSDHAAHGARAKAKVVTRDVAAARAASDASAGGFTILTLSLSASYRSLSARAGGLPATVRVSFTAPGHQTLHESVAVRFRRRSATHAAHHAARGREDQ